MSLQEILRWCMKIMTHCILDKTPYSVSQLSDNKEIFPFLCKRCWGFVVGGVRGRPSMWAEQLSFFPHPRDGGDDCLVFITLKAKGWQPPEEKQPCVLAGNGFVKQPRVGQMSVLSQRLKTALRKCVYSRSPSCHRSHSSRVEPVTSVSKDTDDRKWTTSLLTRSWRWRRDWEVVLPKCGG